MAWRGRNRPGADTEAKLHVDSRAYRASATALAPDQESSPSGRSCLHSRPRCSAHGGEESADDARSFAEWTTALDRILVSFGHLAPAQITADAVAEFRRDLGQGRSPATVIKYETPLRELLDLAVRRGAIQTNPYKLLTTAERLEGPLPREPRV